MASYGRMRNPLQRPEAVLQRAEEFISVGRENDALTSLHEIIKDRRHKQWSSIHEQIMMKHLELCVKLRNVGSAKDALYQYKALTQQVALGSLEKTMRFLLTLAEQKAETAQKESIEKIEEIDDLDVGDAPEALLLSVVSGAVPQDRMDRTVLSPWLRFLWDSYRNCLELLKNNSLVETLYHAIVRQSFAFCIKYQRRNEFRKLCDILRTHLSQLQKNLSQSHGNSSQRINIVESLSIMQETRLIQLDTAIQMELWQEAYKSTEDLHHLMQLSKEKEKRSIKPQSYVNYFDKLSLIFWKGGNGLFHSAALMQKYNIYKDMKKTFAGEEAAEQATKVLLATLSISEDLDMSSILTKHLDMEDMYLANVRVLSALLRLPVAPTRKGILKEIARLNIPDVAQTAVGRLYHLMEVDFAPLEAAKLIEVELTAISELGRGDYTQYIESIRAVVATKILKALTNIYEALPIDRMANIIPFYSRPELEHFLVHITKQRFLKAQVDHREGCIRFGPVDATLSGDVETEYGEIEHSVGGYESMRVHLMRLYELLGATSRGFDVEDHKNVALERFNRLRKIYEYHKDADYDRMLMRKKVIEQHKETNENIRQEKIQKAHFEAVQREEIKRTEEIEKLKIAKDLSDQIRKEEERKEIADKVKRDKYAQNPVYIKLVEEMGEEALRGMDLEVVLSEQRVKLEIERKKQGKKMLQQEKKYDFFVRAFNTEERVIYKKLSDEKRQEAPAKFAESEKMRIARAKEDRERALATFERLEMVKNDAITFIRGVVESHKDDIEKKKLEFQKLLARLKEKKLQERRIQREKDRKKQWEQEKKAEKERQEEEIRAKQEAEREERSAAINASRENRNQRSDRRDRGPDPDSKADNENNWRGSTALPKQRMGPPRPHVEQQRSEFVPRSEVIEPTAAETANDWRGAKLPEPIHREPRMNSSPAPTRPAAPPPQPSVADDSAQWRRNEKPSVAPPTVAPSKSEKYQPPRGDKYQPPTRSSGAPSQPTQNRSAAGAPQPSNDRAAGFASQTSQSRAAGLNSQPPQSRAAGLASPAPQSRAAGLAPQQPPSRGPRAPQGEEPKKVIQRKPQTEGAGSWRS